MDISGTYTLNAPRERVWEALLDPDMLQRTIPGCEKLEPIGPDEWRMRVTIGIAAVKGTYEGTLRMTDRVAPEHYKLVADGTGARSILHGEGTLTLEASGPTTTVVNYTGGAQINGPLAGIANRVAPSVSRMLVTQFFGRLQKDLDAQNSNAPLASAGESAPAASAAHSAPAPAEDAVFDASTSGVWEVHLPEARPLDDEQLPTAALPLDVAPAAPTATAEPAASAVAPAAADAPAPLATAALAESPAPDAPLAEPVPTVAESSAHAQPSAPAPTASAVLAAAATADPLPTGGPPAVATPTTPTTPTASTSTNVSAASAAPPTAPQGGIMSWIARLLGHTD